ncbi:hypothetical protein QRD02_14300 [Aequorivita sp. SDUM287046]|uniref:3D domain-containing protein n=1 Tax=Aequorivita aurantiaca TaxID=3053356 RepID=A0ABT8DJQ6_9FLAO|nr:hypothetical protein [Aequorivita aurantiaca]MDN3725553.1 hypothetical protein [Aequorivita aurantiaca]
MKNHIFIFTFLLFPFISFSQIENDSIEFHFESSKNNWFKIPSNEWKFDGNYAIKRIGYWKGSPCGDVPETERVIGIRRNDTIFINYNKKMDPLCDPRIGVAGNAIDLVINTKKYPNYRNLIIKEVKNEDCKTDSCLIENINNIINKPFINKEEITVKSDSRGGYETYTVYFDYNVPILIERKIKEIIHFDYLDNSTEDKSKYVYAKFYIRNWEKNEFIRVGVFKTLLNNGEIQKIAMPVHYEFDYDKDKISEIKINKRNSR